jgi:hypothetical protein
MFGTWRIKNKLGYQMEVSLKEAATAPVLDLSFNFNAFLGLPTWYKWNGFIQMETGTGFKKKTILVLSIGQF